LGKLHRLDVDKLGLGMLERRGKGDHYIERELSWLLAEVDHELAEKRKGGEEQPFYQAQGNKLADAADWLRRNMPRERSPD
jgi:hypothetical protein